jgi:hypothetical protein
LQRTGCGRRDRAVLSPPGRPFPAAAGARAPAAGACLRREPAGQKGLSSPAAEYAPHGSSLINLSGQLRPFQAPVRDPEGERIGGATTAGLDDIARHFPFAIEIGLRNMVALRRRRCESAGLFRRARNRPSGFGRRPVAQRGHAHPGDRLSAVTRTGEREARTLRAGVADLRREAAFSPGVRMQHPADCNGNSEFPQPPHDVPPWPEPHAPRLPSPAVRHLTGEGRNDP